MRRTHLDQLRQQAEASYPHEACGVLLGQSGPGGERIVHCVVPCSNAEASPERRYSIAAPELLRIQREAREAGLAIVGFYHSHPDWPARWSPADLEEAHWSGCSYVITAVETGRAVASQSFLLAGAGAAKHFEDEPIEVC